MCTTSDAGFIENESNFIIFDFPKVDVRKAELHFDLNKYAIVPEIDFFFRDSSGQGSTECKALGFVVYKCMMSMLGSMSSLHSRAFDFVESDIGQTDDTCQYVEPTELERFVETLSRDYYEGYDWDLDINSDCVSTCNGGYCPAVCGAGGFCCSGTIADNGNCPDSANDAFRRINPNPFGKHFCMTPS